MGDNAPIIIKRKKVIAGGGHHGGAWKVAYADFVTAMMAFFMLMWLLNATTEQQRKGIADYFAPTVPINRISGGGDGVFGGDDIFSESRMIRSGNGGSPLSTESGAMNGDASADQSDSLSAEVAALQNIEDVLLGQGGESALATEALRHIVTRVTDEGLVIEIFDLPDVHLFKDQTSAPTDIMRAITQMIARLLVAVENPVALKGHLSRAARARIQQPIWQLSIERASQTRLLLESAGLDPDRIARITGAADREPVVGDSTAERNTRIEIVVLRSDI